MGVSQMVLEFAKREKGPVVGYVVLLLIGTIVSLIGMTKVTAAMYKSVSGGDSAHSFKLLFALATLTVAFTVTNWGIDYIENHLMPTFHRFVRTKVTQSIIDANETSLMTNTNALRFRAYVSATTSTSTTIFNAIIKQYIPNIIMTVVLVGFLFYLSPAYGGVFLGAAALIAVIFLLNRKNMERNAKSVELKVRHADTFAFDVLKNLETVVAKGQIEAEKATIAAKIAAATRAQIEQSQKFDNVTYMLNGLLIAAVFATMALAIHSLRTGDGKSAGAAPATVHAVLTALSLMTKLQSKMTALSNTNLSMIQNVGRYRANCLTAVQDYNAPPTGTLPVCATGQWCDVQIQFKDVTFTYPGAAAPTVRNFNWSIGPRGIYCLRAPSASGKSTLAKLVVRMFDVDSGSIQLNGMDIRQIDLNDLRASVELMNDRPFMERSIREILCYGSDETCATGPRLQQVWDGMKDMFDGLELDDSVGPNGGSRLSTGMKAVLRFNAALLGDASVILCDEPTNGLSPAFKTYILDSIQALGVNKTVLIITHDAKTASIAQEVRDVTSMVS